MNINSSTCIASTYYIITPSTCSNQCTEMYYTAFQLQTSWRCLYLYLHWRGTAEYCYMKQTAMQPQCTTATGPLYKTSNADADMPLSEHDISFCSPHFGSVRFTSLYKSSRSNVKLTNLYMQNTSSYIIIYLRLPSVHSSCDNIPGWFSLDHTAKHFIYWHNFAKSQSLRFPEGSTLFWVVQISFKHSVGNAERSLNAKNQLDTCSRFNTIMACDTVKQTGRTHI